MGWILYNLKWYDQQVMATCFCITLTHQNSLTNLKCIFYYNVSIEFFFGGGRFQIHLCLYLFPFVWPMNHMFTLACHLMWLCAAVVATHCLYYFFSFMTSYYIGVSTKSLLALNYLQYYRMDNIDRIVVFHFSRLLTVAIYLWHP